MSQRISKAILIFIGSLSTLIVSAQKGNTITTITASDLESHVSFLASPLLMGRMNGEKSLEIAAEYLAAQAKFLGLKPANGDSYFQSYTLYKKLNDTEVETITLQNVAGYIEGSHPILKNEVVVYSAHYDHVGVYDDNIYVGADDNASGCAALLEMAQAFQSLKNKPRRSILFLWVSGEEMGLLGSAAYVRNPLFSLENTVANLNMDMIGRTKRDADTGDQNPMSGPNSVFLITGGQSSDLQKIANQVERRINLDFDYSLSGPYHPLQLFSRSDQYNFVKNDIPVLFFSTGLHTDYHTPRDVIELLDFNKMEAVTRAVYQIGFEVANRKKRLVVDNPFSKWE
jgi:putative aminopeptidase FrvX